MSTITLDFRYAYNQGERRTADPTAYQWDKGHTLDIIVPTAVQSAELHYHKSGDDKAKPFAPNSIEGNTVHANIPNSLFEDSRDIIVYLVVTDDEMYRTEYEGVIDIRARPKPYDYTDDNPENGAQTISGLYGEAKEAIAKAGEAVAKAGEAKTSAAEAKTSETNAKASESNAKASESNAKTYASNASDSATSASESAASIKASADQIAANKKALQTPTTVTDPTSKTVLLAGSQGIDYSKLADAIIAKYQGQTLAGKAQSVKSALDTVRSVQDQTIKTEDSSTPCSYSAGDFFVYDGKLYKASADFSSVTLTADNISTYAEAQTQTAINALNQSLLSGVRIVEHWEYRPKYEIPVNGQLEFDFSKYVSDEKHPYGDNFLIFANTTHSAHALFGFISLVSHTMTSCKGIIEAGLKLSFTRNDDYSVQSIVIKSNSKSYAIGIKDVYILRLS